MASISKRFTASGEARDDVRYRAGGRAVEEAFKRRQDAENRVRQIESERLRGQVVDPRRGREKLADFADCWLDARTAKGKPLTPMTKQGYRGLLRRNIEPTIGQYALADVTPSVVRDWFSKVTVKAGRDQAAKSYRGRGMASGRAERAKALCTALTSTNVLEAAPGIEPGYRALQALA